MKFTCFEVVSVRLEQNGNRACLTRFFYQKVNAKKLNEGLKG